MVLPALIVLLKTFFIVSVLNLSESLLPIIESLPTIAGQLRYSRYSKMTSRNLFADSDILISSLSSQSLSFAEIVSLVVSFLDLSLLRAFTSY